MSNSNDCFRIAPTMSDQSRYVLENVNVMVIDDNKHMLSGFTEYRRVVEARDAGVNEFLAKPISAKALYQRFASIIDNPRPFIRTQDYFGPDRRRQNMGPPRGCAERRADVREQEGAGTGATA